MKIETTKFHCFKCTTKSDENNDFTLGEQLQHNAIDANSYEKIIIDKYNFFGRTYNESVWISEVQNLILLARKGIKQLEQSSLKTDSSTPCFNYAETRKNIVQLWLAAKHVIFKYNLEGNYKQILENLAQNLKNVVESLPKLSELPDYVLFNSTNYYKNDDRFNPSYNFIHLYLDLKWISLTMDIKNNVSNIEENLLALLKDLIYVGIKKFERSPQELGPYLCPCFKEMWFLLQLLVENNQFSGLSKDFWSLFNQVVKEILNFDITPDGKNAYLGLWLLFHVAKIHDFDPKQNSLGQNSTRIIPNYPLVEECLRNILQASCDEKRLRGSLHFLLFFQTKLWPFGANFDLIQILWEHFYKRIQTSFALTTDSKGFLMTQQKFCNFVEIIEVLLKEDQNSSTSYEIFLHLLSFFLKKNPSYWSKLKGRIYSKLSVSKLATFNDTGLQNLITLLLILAHSLNFEELTEKLLNILNQMPKNRVEDNTVIWSAHLCVILMYLKCDLPINNVTVNFLNLVESASANRGKAQLMKMFVEGLGLVEEASSNLQCGQHVLFASIWIKNYLQWCPINEACGLLELISKLIENLKYQGITREWSTTMDSYIVPSLVNLAMGADSPGIVPHLAATIVSLDCQKYSQLIEQFTGDSVNVEIVETFLRDLLQKADIYQLVGHQTLLIQAWIKINMFSQSEHYLNDITSQISKFPEWTQTFGVFDISKTEDILYTAIKLAGNRVKEAKNISEVASMKRWYETYFGKMDTWVQNILNSSEKNNENNKLLIRVYTYGALLFIHCCSALYTKNKTSTLLHRLISTMLLPSSILMNKKPSENLLAALKLTWHLFIRGLVLLDYTNDSYIERILKDIIIRYVPHLHDSNSPIIRCLDYEFKDKDTAFIIDKICTLIAYRSRTVNENAPQALNLILEIFLAKKDISKLKILIDRSIPAILELIMFVENTTYKKLITNIFYALVNHQSYKEFRENVVKCITAIIDKHLAFYSTNIFQMLKFLTKIMKAEILQIIPQLKSAIEKVEKMRGVGYDNTLRKGLQDIKELLKKL